ncbi:hypothetical protein WR25_10029 [Diploscapter pachys]|uniref:Uncharacterized protein n=1 Tax=Diploscapter pachys TaxID=2018661 RepID=A0A2A2KDX2_9BILA|nr:hypothetical protein WR25_10029 [Diploscapter pachys]
MSRPPSAAQSRPKTSSGRSPSARQRPPTGQIAQHHAAMNGSIPVSSAPRPPSRAVSRLSTSSGMAPPPAVPMPIPPRSSMGSRAGQSAVSDQPIAIPPRMGSSMGERPMTGLARPPSALSAINRPVTQQGVAGMRAASRLGTASNFFFI